MPTPSANAAEFRRNNMTYDLNWRSTGPVTVTGIETAAVALGLTVASLRVYLSTGKAVQGITRPNPTTGADDVVTFAKGSCPPAPKQQKTIALPRPRGRPPKQRSDTATETDAFTPIDWRSTQARHKPK